MLLIHKKCKNIYFLVIIQAEKISEYSYLQIIYIHVILSIATFILVVLDTKCKLLEIIF